MSMEGKLLFVTVGTTALYAKLLGEGMRDQEAREGLRAAIKAYEKRSENEKPSQAEEDRLHERVVEAHRIHWACKRRGLFLESERTSAEMTSTSLLLQAQAGLPGPFQATRKDRIVLLASQTAEGEFCAQVNARLMCEHLVDCRCGTDEKKECATVKCRVVKGLEAKGFSAVTEALLDIVREFVRDKDRRFSFNITGGYKGAIPSITWCAIEYAGCELFYQHVSQDRVVRVRFSLRDGMPSEDVLYGVSEGA